MAIDMSTENSSLVTSPRISFSHDLCQTEDAEKTVDKRSRRDSSLLDSTSEDFDFCISTSIEAVTSSAEELFSNGLIRTFQEKLVTSEYLAFSKPQAEASIFPPLPTNGVPKQDSLKGSAASSTDQAEQKNQQAKSFWRIKRSTSLHCDNKRSSFWSLPLLSRSNSTGSVPNSKQITKENSNHKQNANSKQQKNASGLSASPSCTSFDVYPLLQKPPLRKNYLGPKANGLRINPVLNVPPPYISKGTANLLGLGSFFRNGKEKKIKK